ncbi:Transcription antitermination protein RfaH [compost metagenome]
MQCVTGSSAKRWYLVQCKPRQDQRALEHLERQGYTCLLPEHCVERLTRGKLQLRSEPLFPGYLFIHLDRVEDNWLPIRSTRGVSQIVSFGNQPIPVPNEVIERLQNRTISEPAPVFAEGDRVIIDNEAFQNIDAIFMARDGEERVLLLLNILQRETVVSVPLRQVASYR